jgi:hypothetical protein
MAGETLGVSKADWLGMSTVATFWAMIEVTVALIAINLPALRPGALIRNSGLYKWFSGLSSRFSSRYSASKSSSKNSSQNSRKRAGEKQHSGGIPMQAPWQSLATGMHSAGGDDESEQELKSGIYYERDYRISESRIPVDDHDVQRRYGEFFPLGHPQSPQGPRNMV